ncbi:GCN5-related N-acetyltransferase 4, chloroplastic [Orobanche minor]
MQIISLVNSSSINLSLSLNIRNLKHQYFSSPVSNKISHYEIPASGFPSSPPQISGPLCRASQVAELFPTRSPEIVVREARIEDCWGVAEAYCRSFFPEYSFPLDFVLRVDRLVGMLFGFSVPTGCKRTCLVAVTGSCGGASDDLKIGSLDGKISLNKGCVAGILTVDTVADFLPRKGPLRQRRVREANPDLKGTGIAYISNLAVREKFRRKGIAKRLIAKAETKAINWDCRAIALHCDLSNPGATKLYTSQGFKRIKIPQGANWPYPKI